MGSISCDSQYDPCSMHLGPLLLLMAGAAAVGVVHSVLPDHWVPLAVVARTERWSLRRGGGGEPPAARRHRAHRISLRGGGPPVGPPFPKSNRNPQWPHLR